MHWCLQRSFDPLAVHTSPRFSPGSDHEAMWEAMQGSQATGASWRTQTCFWEACGENAARDTPFLPSQESISIIFQVFVFLVKAFEEIMHHERMELGECFKLLSRESLVTFSELWLAWVSWDETVTGWEVRGENARAERKDKRLLCSCASNARKSLGKEMERIRRRGTKRATDGVLEWILFQFFFSDPNARVRTVCVHTT